MKVTLPKLQQVAPIGNSKNKIIHCLKKYNELDFVELSSDNNSLSIGILDFDVTITTIPDFEDSSNDYVLLSNIRPSVENLVDGSLKLVWKKHPLLKQYSADEIVRSWKSRFSFIEETDEINGLREPQIAGLFSLLSHLKVNKEAATVVMPTGTGKTETMMSALIAHGCNKLLVTVPSDALRNQLSRKFIELGLLRTFGIVHDDAINPKVGVIQSKFQTISELETFINESNVIISTMNVLASSSPAQQNLIADKCSHIFIDEAHHVKAKSWDSFRQLFKPEKVIQFTATPFRNDKKRLDGRIIFNFPLKKAQEQGYFKKIRLVSLREYDLELADEKIADRAVEILREDIANGKNHILMARCSTKLRAQKVFEFYRQHSDLNPVVIYSGVSGKRQIMNDIIGLQHKIIVAVDMLGEGFDLPQLKVAAFHDIRKSLPITLQFAGRFTRTSLDNDLGDASFVVNIADTNVTKELDDLYAQDSDWNFLLNSLSHAQIEEQQGFEDFIAGFEGINDESIPFQNIRPALSTVVYKNRTNEWFPTNFRAGLPNIDSLEYVLHDINRDEQMLVVIYAEKSDVDWGNIRDIYQINWNVIVAYWETRNNLLFIHGSDKSGLYKDMARAIIGTDAELINQLNIFRVFSGINRVSLQNVGLKEFLGKHIKFRMTVGTDIEAALTMAETTRGQKAFVFGSGYEDGNKITLGCSYKGRVWSYQTGNLRSFKSWCKKLGDKLVDENIDPNQVLRNTLIPRIVFQRPLDVMPICIDWHEEMYKYKETRYKLIIDGRQFNLSNSELVLENPSLSENIRFKLIADDISIVYEITHGVQEDNDGNEIPIYEVTQISTNTVIIEFGTRTLTPKDFFETYEPTIWFADGSALHGNYLIELRQQIGVFCASDLIDWDWNGTDLSEESQGVNPKRQNSIQYNVIQRLQRVDYDIIYDDDYAGEIADVITIMENDNQLSIELYHLKYANGGNISRQVSNFYEVCGQAQKCIHWKHKPGREFFDHLLRRISKTRNGQSCSRLEKGTIQQLERLQDMARRDIPMTFKVFIVQPSLSKQEVVQNEDNFKSILTLLGVTNNYLKETAAIDLNVIINQ